MTAFTMKLIAVALASLMLISGPAIAADCANKLDWKPVTQLSNYDVDRLTYCLGVSHESALSSEQTERSNDDNILVAKWDMDGDKVDDSYFVFNTNPEWCGSGGCATYVTYGTPPDVCVPLDLGHSGYPGPGGRPEITVECDVYPDTGMKSIHVMDEYVDPALFGWENFLKRQNN